MPELPEIANLAHQMQATLVGKTIAGIEVLQPKSLNVPEVDFVAALTGARLRAVTYHGKWIRVAMTRGWLFLSLGMGGEIRLVTRETLPEKYRVLFDFDDGTTLSINFWWFGYAHYAPLDDPTSHKMTAKLGPNALAVTADDLRALFKGRRGRIKSFLLDQSKIAGIGNFYIHDILFAARVHPLRTIDTLTDGQTDALADAIHTNLRAALDKGGASYEVDLYGQPGAYTMADVVIGYKEGQSCPVCGTEIEKIKTGSTSSFICPQCQIDGNSEMRQRSENQQFPE